jgi:hypothetical protein
MDHVKALQKVVASLVPPQDTVLGKLFIEEVYFYYEGPRLFSAISASGQRYFAVDVDEDSDSDTYLYVAVSKDRFFAVRSGLVSLMEAYTSPENGLVFAVKAVYRDTQRNELESLLPSDLPDAWLPENHCVPLSK